jgi:hypothetical protein
MGLGMNNMILLSGVILIGGGAYMIIKRFLSGNKSTNVQDKEMSLTYKDRFNAIIKRIETSEYYHKNTSQTISYMIQLIVDYMNYNEAEIALEGNPITPQNSIVFDVYRDIDRELHPDKDIRCLNTRQDVDINEFPILLNPWNGDRVVNAMFLINPDNVFNGEAYEINIVNTYITPIDIIVCDGGNHSQFAAKQKNMGRTLITQKYDITHLYDEVEFDGQGFKQRGASDYIRLQYKGEIVFYAGVLFELGRYKL